MDLLTAPLDTIREDVEAALFGEPGTGIDVRSPLLLVFRNKGKRVREAWRTGGKLSPILRGALAGLEKGYDHLELALAHNGRAIRQEEWAPDRLRDDRGVLGLAMTWGGQTLRAAPTRMVARNIGFRTAFEELSGGLGCTPEQFWAEDGQLCLFETRQVFIRINEELGVDPVEVFRGQAVIDLDAIDTATVTDLALGMADWLRRHCDEAGALTYSWHPSRGKAGPGDNSIRRFMAARSLGLIAQWTGMDDDREVAIRALDRLLGDTYREVDGVGAIESRGTVKLGALALAAMAIMDSPNPDRYADRLAGLWRGIDALANDDGSFRTFALPEDRTDQQNFYPGEALFAWARRLADRPDSDLEARFMRHAEHYRRRFEADPNPAFVPWHTLARATLLEAAPERDPISLAFVFSMNDWLVTLQQWDTAPHPDMKGRFYDPESPQYGPPHASSTGVYLEGLVAAWRLARAVDDTDRERRYGKAIRRGLRSLRQLQYRDTIEETGLFYISKRLQALGGIRTELWDNRIRVDNVQHGLSAILDLFSKEGDAEALLGPIPLERHFRRFDVDIPLDNLKAEVDANVAMFDVDERRQTAIRVQRETQAIPLRGAARPIPEGIAVRDWHRTVEAEGAAHFPHLMETLHAFAKSQGGRLARAMVVRLRPNSRVHRHRDEGAYYRGTRRYHLILSSPAGSAMISGGLQTIMSEGELWWFDNLVSHEAHNPGGDWRVHAIFDLEWPETVASMSLEGARKEPFLALKSA